MDSYPSEAWQRLGVVLAERRGQLGYGFRHRGAFAADNGLKLSARTLQRLEQAERSRYPDATLAVAETIYRLAPGSIKSVLKGGEPVFAEEAAARDQPDLTAECDHERRLLDSKEISEGEKRRRIMAHRDEGHADWCGRYGVKNAGMEESLRA